MHWQSVFSKFCAHYLSYIGESFHLEIMYISRVILMKARGSGNYAALYNLILINLCIFF